MLLYQTDAELLFPARVIPTLRNLRGEAFRALIDKLAACPSETDVEILGFALMMIRLGNCLLCTPDSHRAMHGCTLCAHKTLRNFKGTDADLIQHWQTACQDVRGWLEKNIAVEV